MQYRGRDLRYGYCVAVLVLSLAIGGQTSKAQEAGNAGTSERVVESNGMELRMSFTNPDGTPATTENGRLQIIQIQDNNAQPNQFELQFQGADGRNLFTVEPDSAELEPTTMRQTRIGDYATDGVLLAGDMWRSMEQWGVAGMLGSIKLATIIPGQSPEAFAEANDVELRNLELLNPLVEFSAIRSETPVCISSSHRVLPGEDLSLLANLYQTDQATLVELNDLEPQESIVWRKLTVPAVTEKGRSGFSFYIVKYSPVDRVPSFQPRSDLLVQHTVSEGENLTSIAEKYGQPRGRIAWINNIGDDQSVSAGQLLVVRSEITLAGNVDPSQLVYELETVRGHQLEAVLEANEMQSPSEFTPGQTIYLPAMGR
ncbi:MAG: LysM peptidoglycan-binding domain-containing protein [Planctomycetota bacterium]